MTHIWLVLISGLMACHGDPPPTSLPTEQIKGEESYQVWVRARSPIMLGDPIVLRAGFASKARINTEQEWRIDSLKILIDEDPVLWAFPEDFKAEMGIPFPGKRRFSIPTGEIRIEAATARQPCRWVFQPDSEDKNGTTFHLPSEGMLPGQHRVLIEARISEWRGGARNTSRVLETQAQFDVLAKEAADPIKVLNDCKDWSDLGEQFSVGPVYLSQRRIAINFTLGRPAGMDLAFEAYVLSAEGEQKSRLGIVYWGKDESGTKSLFVDSDLRLDTSELDHGAKILLKSSRNAVSKSLSLFSFCVREIRLGPIEIKGGNPLTPQPALICSDPEAP